MPRKKSTPKTSTSSPIKTPKKKSTTTSTPNPKNQPDDDVDFGVSDVSDVDDEAEPTENNTDDLPDLEYDSIEESSLKYTPIIRQQIIYLHPNNRKTSEVITPFEYSEITSIRAVQIENGGTCWTDTGELTDPIKMAEKELRDRKCPLKLERRLTDDIYEIWDVNKMALSQY